MSAADYADSSVIITWRVEQDWSHETDFGDMAKVLKISKAALAKILDGDESLDEVTGKVAATLAKLGDLISEEISVDEVAEA